jgi:3-oxoacyl-[acyl-carrier protein] reductase
MDLGLKGKRAVVMAASRGLGYASALGLAREGCHLIVCSRDQQRIEAAADHSARDRPGDRPAADVSSASEASAWWANVEYGDLEIVVHNAGGRRRDAGDDRRAVAQGVRTEPAEFHAHRAPPCEMRRPARRLLTIASSSIKQPIPNLALSMRCAPACGASQNLSARSAGHSRQMIARAASIPNASPS